MKQKFDVPALNHSSTLIVNTWIMCVNKMVIWNQRKVIIYAYIYIYI